MQEGSRRLRTKTVNATIPKVNKTQVFWQKCHVFFVAGMLKESVIMRIVEAAGRQCNHQNLHGGCKKEASPRVSCE